MKKWTVLLAVMLCAALAGCNQSASSPSDTPSESQEMPGAVSAEPTQEPSEEPAETPEEPSTELTLPPEDGQTATLYIGTRAEGFREYPMAYTGELRAEALIQGIADLTGWDLTLADEVTSGKGGMGVCLSGESSLFTGPPDPQKEEFHMYSAEQLAETILDSIQKTLQRNFVLEPGDPDLLDIWFYREGTKPLELPDLGLSWPIDQPYQWTGAQSE